MAAEEPTPAGGSAAAIGVAMASALIAKVARVSTDWPDARAVVAQADHLSRRIAPLAQSDAEYEEASPPSISRISSSPRSRTWRWARC